jgi:hypothetical protein
MSVALGKKRRKKLYLYQSIVSPHSVAVLKGSGVIQTGLAE